MFYGYCFPFSHFCSIQAYAAWPVNRSVTWVAVTKETGGGENEDEWVGR
jgi:hypothetical protein